MDRPKPTVTVGQSKMILISEICSTAFSHSTGNRDADRYTDFGIGSVRRTEPTQKSVGSKSVQNRFKTVGFLSVFRRFFVGFGNFSSIFSQFSVKFKNF